jgi:hypothetical protein
LGKNRLPNGRLGVNDASSAVAVQFWISSLRWVIRFSSISTSNIKRQNLKMRMSMRRLTRLTNEFSKEVANLEAAVALNYMITIFPDHQTWRMTPATKAGVGDHVWDLEKLSVCHTSALSDLVSSNAERARSKPI